MRKPYTTDLTDIQWEILRPLIPDAKPGGRPREVDLREVINTLLYQDRTGCQWDMLPHDLLPKSTVFDYFTAGHACMTHSPACRNQPRMSSGVTSRNPSPMAS